MKKLTFKPALQQFDDQTQSQIRKRIETFAGVSHMTVYNWLSLTNPSEPAISKAVIIADVFAKYGYHGKIWFEVCQRCSGTGQFTNQYDQGVYIEECKTCNGRGWLL